jgi:hypothetical protein
MSSSVHSLIWIPMQPISPKVHSIAHSSPFNIIKIRDKQLNISSLCQDVEYKKV